jgi:hypothetical protein
MRLGRGLNGSEPDTGGGEGDRGEEVSGKLVEAGSDASELLELAEEPLDEVAFAVELRRDRALQVDAALGGDVCLAAGSRDEIENSAAVIAAVGDECLGWWQAGQEVRRGGLVGGLTGRDQKPDWQPILIDHGVDLGT